MRVIAIATVVIGLAAFALPALAQQSQVDCEAARCAVQQQIDTHCSCGVKNGKQNHGRYVSCVAHIIKQLSASGDIPVQCKGKIIRCAARSTCGKKEGFVICQIPTDTCNLVADTCDLSTSTCTSNPAIFCSADADCPAVGTCAADPTVSCATDLDCGSRCKISSTAERCQLRGGIVDPTKTTCCSSCSTAP